ncbi:MAG: NmrA/HSCARG family protein [Acidimicrobiia bacterium]|nr:MAG: NmrA/HSCARG family protein [Acidimicrobiia bacterium]
MSVIAVVGATGTIGSRVAARLAERGHEVRAISRNPGTPTEGVESFAADLTDSDQAVAALEGATGVYLTPPESGDNPLALETAVTRNVIDAAAKHAVDHLVVHTAVRADRGDTGSRVLDNKTGIEDAVAASGVGYTILRPAWYLQNLWGARDYLEQGIVSLPWSGDMVWAATDVSDIATAAVAFLEHGPTDRGYDVHIPGGVTGFQIAEAATRVLGKDVDYHEAQVSTRDYVEVFPISDPHKDLYAELFDYFRSTTYLGDPGPVIETLDGFQPRGLDDFLSQELFAGR